MEYILNDFVGREKREGNILVDCRFLGYSRRIPAGSHSKPLYALSAPLRGISVALTYPNSLASRGIDAAESTLGGNAVGSAPPSTELVMQLVARINELEHRLYVVEDQIKQKGDTHE